MARSGPGPRQCRIVKAPRNHSIGVGIRSVLIAKGIGIASRHVAARLKNSFAMTTSGCCATSLCNGVTRRILGDLAGYRPQAPETAQTLVAPLCAPRAARVRREREPTIAFLM